MSIRDIVMVDAPTLEMLVRGYRLLHRGATDSFAEFLAAVVILRPRELVWVVGDELRSCGVSESDVRVALRNALPVGSRLVWVKDGVQDVYWNEGLPFGYSSFVLVSLPDGGSYEFSGSAVVAMRSFSGWRYEQVDGSGGTVSSGSSDSSSMGSDVVSLGGVVRGEGIGSAGIGSGDSGSVDSGSEGSSSKGSSSKGSSSSRRRRSRKRDG